MRANPKHGRTLGLAYDTLRLEGALLLPDLLEKAAQGLASHGDEAAYQTPKGFSLQEEYGRAFRIAQAQWKAFAARIPREDLDAAEVTRQFVEEFLRDGLGYRDLRATPPVQAGDRRYPIDFLAGQNGQFPIVIAPHRLSLDDPDPRFVPRHVQDSGGPRRKSAFQLAQEFLNASPDHTWGLVTNGRQLRLLRDANTLTRPSFLEFDLETVLEGARYADFAALWRLLHASRIDGAHTVWEIWRAEGQQEGARVREGLREGVTQALIALGEGFLKHPGNEPLRRRLIAGELAANAPDGNGYYPQLLRLVYRLIFLIAVEERGLLHPRDDSPEAIAARRIYAEGYSAARLRDRCLRRPAHDQHDDLWQSLAVVFRGLARGQPRLALPALGGLFAPDQCPDLDAAHLTNRDLLAAIRCLRWSNRSGALAPVDYRNMGPEELGSVYESLLELVPDADPHARRFGFIGLTTDGSTQGNARKLSGSYYTPDSLVQALIQSALDPVIEARIQARPDAPTEALLSITVLDPACGSGHFLLAAARRLAERLAQLRAPEGAVRPEDYRHALREVIGRCLYGVDRNPMALELARFALWLEGFEEGRSLSFLDHHLICGDALIGLTDLDPLALGIPDAAFKPLSGDDKAVCRALAKENKEGLKAFAKRRDERNLPLALEQDNLLAERAALEALPDGTLEAARAKEAAWRTYAEHEQASRLHRAADLTIGAFLVPKADGAALTATPTSRNLYLALHSDRAPHELAAAHQAARLAAAQSCARAARVLHWPLAFLPVWARGGFDCVLGNPPWERIKLQEEEFFATRHPLVAAAKNKAERARRIEWLAQGRLARQLYPELEHPAQECEAEQRLHAEFIEARRTAEAASAFAHVKGEDGGRYPLTGVGDVNTYALFAETIGRIVSSNGRAGFIVPTGIATDDSTKAYFAQVAGGGKLASLYDFENREGLFPGVHRSYKFCLLTLGQAQAAEFAFFLTDPAQLADERRRFTLSAEDFRRINPNTRTCPVFRSKKDAELTRKIYARVPVLIREAQGGEPEWNPWGVSFMRMFDMANDSHLFLANGEWGMANGGEGAGHSPFATHHSPLYEAKLIHQFDHRWATYGADGASRDVTPAEKADPAFTVTPRYWVGAAEVDKRLADKGWTRGWLMGWRDICRATDERTVIAAVVPRTAIGNKIPLILPSEKVSPRQVAALLANLSALCFDFAARQKIGGTTLNYFIAKQLPVLPPDFYSEDDLAFIAPRVLELTYTAHDLAPWAEDLGYAGEPFVFDAERRARLRAELDAWYARAYGLSRDDLCYVLDPEAAMGAGYPSETFRVLKQNEMRAFGEYRTARLVLEAFSRMELAEARGEPYVSLLDPPPGQKPRPAYSARAALRDEDDARLAGLVLALIRSAGTLPRQHIVMALTLIADPDRTKPPVDDEAVERLRAYRRQHASIFDSERIGRLNILLDELERAHAIRRDGDQVSARPDGTVPARVIVAPDTEEVAAILLRAARSALEGAAAGTTELQPTGKRA
jgi:hypothetical protein